MTVYTLKDMGQAVLDMRWGEPEKYQPGTVSVPATNSGRRSGTSCQDRDGCTRSCDSWRRGRGAALA